MFATLTIGRIRGIPIKLHPTFLLALPLFAYLMAAQHFAGAFGGLTAAAWAWGALLAIGLFASVTIHELAHSLVALRFQVPVRDVTLLPIGGVSALARSPRDGRAEFWITLVGPLTNFALAVPLIAIGWLGMPDRPAGAAMFVQWMGWMNLSLGAFNLFLPAFPMDGGRILRALLSRKLGHARATRTAAAVGRATSIALGIVGLFVGNLMLILIAVFVYFGANAEEHATTLHETITRYRMADLIDPIPPADPRTLVGIARARMEHELHPVLPVAQDGVVLGVILYQDLKDDPSGSASIASHVRPAPLLSASAPASALEATDADTTPPVVVDDAGRYVGLFSLEALRRALAMEPTT